MASSHDLDTYFPHHGDRELIDLNDIWFSDHGMDIEVPQYSDEIWPGQDHDGRSAHDVASSWPQSRSYMNRTLFILSSSFHQLYV